MKPRVTLSVIKADVGGFVGHSHMHPDLLEEARERLAIAKLRGPLFDYFVTSCGDDIGLIMTHDLGVDSEEIHQLAWGVFEHCTQVAKNLKLYGAGQDLLKDSFAGNVRGMGPGVAEMAIEERTAEPLLVFFADKTSAGAWNLPLFRMFADPFNTAGLVISPAMHDGYRFDVLDVQQRQDHQPGHPGGDVRPAGLHRRLGPVSGAERLQQGHGRDRRRLLHAAAGAHRRQVRGQG